MTISMFRIILISESFCTVSAAKWLWSTYEVFSEEYKTQLVELYVEMIRTKDQIKILFC